MLSTDGMQAAASVTSSQTSMLAGEIKDLIEVSRELTKMLGSGNIMMKKTIDKHDLILDKLQDTESSVAVLVKALSRLEEEAAQKLLDSADERKLCASRLSEIEKELHQASEKNTSLQAEINFLIKDLEELKEMDANTNRMQEEVDDETTKVIPATRYLAQLYHKVTKMDWDYTAEPTLVRGIYYGGDIAQPINLDCTKLSQSDVCDYLWSMLPTEWEPLPRTKAQD